MRVSDLIPQSSGSASLGVDQDGFSAFDITSIAPFNHVHMMSGVWHDTLLGQSGVIRYSKAANAFQVSVDGGWTFNDLTTAATTVTSVGVIGGANLTGNIDLASHASGFLAITDTGGASPINFNVNTLGLSGLWMFPPQGFNGRVVNLLTDFNGTSVQGVVNVIGASGVVVDIVGQTMTITAANQIPRCFSTTFVASTAIAVTHNLGSLNVIVQVYDDQSPRTQIEPDLISVTNSNTVGIRFNVAQAGLAVVFAC